MFFERALCDFARAGRFLEYSSRSFAPSPQLWSPDHALVMPCHFKKSLRHSALLKLYLVLPTARNRASQTRRPSSHSPDAPAASSAAETARFGHLIFDSSSKARASLRQLKDPGRRFALPVGSVSSPLLPKGTLGGGELNSHMVGLKEAGEPSEKNLRKSF